MFIVSNQLVAKVLSLQLITLWFCFCSSLLQRQISPPPFGKTRSGSGKCIRSDGIAHSLMNTPLFSVIDDLLECDALFDEKGSFSPYVLSRNADRNSSGGLIITLHPNITLTTDILSITGNQLYQQTADSFRRSLLPQLLDARCGLTQLSQLGANKVLLKWNVTFIPDSIVPLTIIGKLLPFVSVKFVDVLHLERYRSTFSWEKLLQFLSLIVLRGEMRLPHAVIQGTTELIFSAEWDSISLEDTLDYCTAATTTANTSTTATASSIVTATGIAASKSTTTLSSSYDEYNEKLQVSSVDEIGQRSGVAGEEFIRDTPTATAPAVATKRAASVSANRTTAAAAAEALIGSDSRAVRQWLLVSQRESLLLVRSINAGTLRNRKLAFDVLQFLDSARPAYISIDQWNYLLAEKVRYSAVPGMKQFDIDGITDSLSPQQSQGSVVAATARRLPYVLLAALLLSLAALVVVQSSGVFPTQHSAAEIDAWIDKNYSY